MTDIRVKRIYEEPSKHDGLRILVDKLWPRGITKQRARVDHWVKEIAPSHELRRWYNHDPSKWPEFRKKYFAELRKNPHVGKLRELLHAGTVTFVFSSKEQLLNNAHALREYLRNTPPF